MRPLLTQNELEVPSDVDIQIKARRVVVKGPRGELVKDFSHICADVFLVEEEGVKKVKVEVHLRRKKELSSLRTVISHIRNMVTGVTKGFRYGLRTQRVPARAHSRTRVRQHAACAAGSVPAPRWTTALLIQ